MKKEIVLAGQILGYGVIGAGLGSYASGTAAEILMQDVKYNRNNVAEAVLKADLTGIPSNNDDLKMKKILDEQYLYLNDIPIKTFLAGSGFLLAGATLLMILGPDPLNPKR